MTATQKECERELRSHVTHIAEVIPLPHVNDDVLYERLRALLGWIYL